MHAFRPTLRVFAATLHCLCVRFGVKWAAVFRPSCSGCVSSLLNFDNVRREHMLVATLRVVTAP